MEKLILTDADFESSLDIATSIHGIHIFVQVATEHFKACDGVDFWNDFGWRFMDYLVDKCPAEDLIGLIDIFSRFAPAGEVLLALSNYMVEHWVDEEMELSCVCKIVECVDNVLARTPERLVSKRLQMVFEPCLRILLSAGNISSKDKAHVEKILNVMFRWSGDDAEKKSSASRVLLPLVVATQTKIEKLTEFDNFIKSKQCKDYMNSKEISTGVALWTVMNGKVCFNNHKLIESIEYLLANSFNPHFYPLIFHKVGSLYRSVYEELDEESLMNPRLQQLKNALIFFCCQCPDQKLRMESFKLFQGMSELFSSSSLLLFLLQTLKQVPFLNFQVAIIDLIKRKSIVSNNFKQNVFENFHEILKFDGYNDDQKAEVDGFVTLHLQILNLIFTIDVPRDQKYVIESYLKQLTDYLKQLEDKDYYEKMSFLLESVRNKY